MHRTVHFVNESKIECGTRQRVHDNCEYTSFAIIACDGSDSHSFGREENEMKEKADIFIRWRGTKVDDQDQVHCVASDAIYIHIYLHDSHTNIKHGGAAPHSFAKSTGSNGKQFHLNNIFCAVVTWPFPDGMP